MKKLAVSLILALAVSAAPASVFADKSFTDVNTTTTYSWAATPLEFMVNNNIISGYADGSFKPKQLVSKAEFSTMLTRLFDKYNENVKKKSGDDWTAQAIRKLEQPDYFAKNYYTTNGYKMTRIETAHLIANNFDGFFLKDMKDAELLKAVSGIKDLKVRVFGFNDYKTFNDAFIKRNTTMKYSTYEFNEYLLRKDNAGVLFQDDFDYPAALTLANFVKSGLMTPNNGYFRPQAKITRIEAAVFLYKLASYMDEQGVLSKYSSITLK